MQLKSIFSSFSTGNHIELTNVLGVQPPLALRYWHYSEVDALVNHIAVKQILLFVSRFLCNPSMTICLNSE